MVDDLAILIECFELNYPKFLLSGIMSVGFNDLRTEILCKIVDCFLLRSLRQAHIHESGVVIEHQTARSFQHIFGLGSPPLCFNGASVGYHSSIIFRAYSIQDVLVNLLLPGGVLHRVNDKLRV